MGAPTQPGWLNSVRLTAVHVERKKVGLRLGVGEGEKREGLEVGVAEEVRESVGVLDQLGEVEREMVSVAEAVGVVEQKAEGVEEGGGVPVMLLDLLAVTLRLGVWLAEEVRDHDEDREIDLDVLMEWERVAPWTGHHRPASIAAARQARAVWAANPRDMPAYKVHTTHVGMKST